MGSETSIASAAVGKLGRKVLSLTTKTLLRVIPPDPKRLAIRAFPDFDDTTTALLPGLNNHYKVTVLTTAKTSRPVQSWNRVDVRSGLSPLGVWRFLRAGTVVFTHGIYFSAPPVRGRVFVNAWHGMPLKKIGRMLGPVEVPSFTFTVSTSPLFSAILAESFGCDLSAIKTIGLPRNDTLRAAALLPNSNTIMVMPTYRRAVIGAPRQEGSEDQSRPSSQEIAQLRKAAHSQGLTFVVRLHPLCDPEEVQYWETLGPVLSNEDLHQSGETLYAVLGRSAALVTDYSSVAIDYLVTGRPIFLVQPDVASYDDDRGFAVPPHQFMKIGTAVNSYAQLAERIAAGLDANNHPKPGEFYTAPFEGASARMVAEIRGAHCER